MQNVNLKIEGGFFKLSSDKVAILLQLPSRKEDLLRIKVNLITSA